jgi:hypothetical protein
MAASGAGFAFGRTAFAAVQNYNADWRRAPRLTFLQILNSLLDVAEALLRLPGNLF